MGKKKRERVEHTGDREELLPLLESFAWIPKNLRGGEAAPGDLWP